MRYILILVLGLCTACSGANSANGGDGLTVNAIPDKVSLDVGSLPAVSDSDFERAKEFFVSSNTAESLSGQILISNNESSRDRDDRQKAYDRLNADQKTAVTQIQAACHVLQSASPQSSLNFNESLHTNPECTLVDMSRASSTVYDVIEHDASGENGVLRLTGNTSRNVLYKDAVLARLAGLSTETFNSRFGGRVEIHPGSQRSYAKVILGGSADLLVSEMGHAEVSGRGEILEENGQRHVIVYFHIRVGQHSYDYAVHAEVSGGVATPKEFYVGNRSLNQQEMNALNVADFVRGF